MGFTVVGLDSFLASGHPDARHDLPPQMGPQRSTDGGRNWKTVSLLGEADLHVLRAAGERIYGVDSGTGAFLTSADGGRTWQQRTPPAPVFDLAPSPGDAARLVAATERDMRNRFLVALVFTVPIVLWSMVGTKLLGPELATPFDIDHDVWQVLLSLPVVLYA